MNGTQLKVTRAAILFGSFASNPSVDYTLFVMLNKLLNRVTYLDLLIRKRATGCPKELAKRLGITERAWYKIRDELVNDLGLPIAYDPHLKTYYYTEAGEFVFQFIRKVDVDNLEKLTEV